MTDWSGRRSSRGSPPSCSTGCLGMRSPARTAAFHGIVTWSPTIDLEHLKLLSQEIVLGAGVHLVFHAWAAAPIVEDGRLTGAVFESKEGRLAIRAAVTIDCTGDGDRFIAPASAARA